MDKIIIIHWDKSTGPEPVIQYPPDKKFPPKDLFLKIWAIHELEKDNSMIEFAPDEKSKQYLSLLQNFEDEIYFLILEYEQESVMDNVVVDHPDILAIISKNLIELIHTEKITRAISEAYNTIKNLSVVEEEEILLSFFRDKIKFTILKILRKGAISRKQLIEILKNKYGFLTTNIDLILVAFLRENLILKKNLYGKRVFYFLIKDISYMRLPPKNIESELFREDKKSLSKYKQKIRDHFTKKNCEGFIDEKKILKYLTNKDILQLIKELRGKSISVKACLNILNNREDILEDLLDENYIYEVKGTILLFSDIRFIKFTPSYIVDNLIQRYEREEIGKEEFLIHLQLLAQENQEPPKLQFEIN